MTTNVLERSLNSAVLQVEGSLRAPAQGELCRRVRGLLQNGERRIVLDLSRLSNIDASGIGELMAAFNTASAAGATLQVSKVSARVRRLLDVAGVLRLLTAAAPVRRNVEAQCCWLR